MTILFFDTETSGLPAKGKPLADQPHVLQLALSLYDDTRRPIFEVSTLIRPIEFFSIPEQAYNVHGISFDMCDQLGVGFASAIGLIEFACGKASRAVAHNAQFDIKLLDFLYQRADNGKKLPELLRNSFCTCDAATPILKLPPTEKMRAAGFNKPKRPRLEECYSAFFHEELSGAHDALVDTRGCARVYFHLEDNYPRSVA